jgi:uncharacterized membrane protein YcgQ (UPF0703/DUF1980 family)
MFKSGIAQKATAFSILDSPLDSSAIDSINRLRRRVYAQLSPFKGKKISFTGFNYFFGN